MSVTTAARGDLRAQVARMARSAPRWNVNQIAARLRCDPSTVHRHLRDLRGPHRRQPPGRWQRRAASWSSGQAAVVARLAADPDPDVRLRAMASPICPPVLRPRFAVDPDLRVRRAAAASAFTSPAALARLAAGRDPDVLDAVVQHPDCPAAVLWRLADSRSAWRRLKVAGHPNAVPGLLERMAPDPDMAVRIQVGAHPRCPPKTRARIDMEVFGAL